MAGETALRILVADDNEINQRVIRGMLEHRGHEVDSVHNGEEVLCALAANPYDLVIMDCMMPSMDGYESTRKIRASKNQGFDPDIPVLAITALAAPGDREKCLACGMDDYISKPVVADYLFEKLDTLFGELEPSDSRAATAVHAPSPPPADILDSLKDRLATDLKHWRQELQRLSNTDGLQALGQLAHKIRGAADVFGEQALSKAAENLENCARNNDGKSAPGLKSRLTEEIRHLESRLHPPRRKHD
ncbi:response regulator [Elongatibacter sediminis]|uniref:Response regulator n=1 Tax=Elongatibacter sediminis TaxID=3119006 RepID=A0AAW9REE9_9GAMM